MNLRCHECGATANKKGEPFPTRQALYQHIWTAHGIKVRRKRKLPDEEPETYQSLGLEALVIYREREEW